MERLTEKHYGAQDYYMVCSENCANDAEMCGGCPWLEKIINRLGVYEDSNLEPEDITRVFNEAAVLKLASQVLGTSPDHLRELVQAEKEGRLRFLPKSGEGTCGSCAHFARDPGTRAGTCDIRDHCKDRWGHDDATRGKFRPSQSRKGCKMYMPRQEAEAALEAKKGGEGNG